MSTSGRIQSSVANFSYFYVQWQLSQQDVTNNRSLINWQAGVNTASGAYWMLNAVKIYGIYINGSSSLGSGTWSNIGGSYSGNGDHQLLSGSLWIDHNNDGSKTFSSSISAWFYGNGNESASGSWALPTIPRATQPSLPSSFDIGSTVTISLPRASSSFTHVVEYSFNGQTGTISTNATSSVNWAVPTSLANTRPNNTSGTGTITAKTYNGSSYIGTKTASFTANIPDTSSFQPSLSGVSIAEAVAAVSNKFSSYIQTQSKISASFTSSGAYGSTIIKEEVSYDSKTYSGNTVITDLLANSGAHDITLTATDSRGRVATYTQTINVTAYAPPAITTLTAVRSDATGVANDEGAYAQVTMVASITPLSDINTVAFTLRYKKRSDTTWSTVDVTPATGYVLNSGYLISSVNVDYAYDVELDASDYFTSTASTASVPTAFTIMDFNADGKSVSFGKVSDVTGRFEIGSKLTTNIITPSSTADSNFIQLRRPDDSLLADISVGTSGTGLHINTYDATSAKQGVIGVNENGSVSIPSGITAGAAVDFSAASSFTAPNSSVTSNMLSINKSVDANGWTVLDFGSFKRYVLRTLSYTTLSTINGYQYLGPLTEPSGHALPVGIPNMGSVIDYDYSMIMAGNSPWIRLGVENILYDTGHTTLGNYYLYNTAGGSFNIQYIFITHIIEA